MGAAPLMAQSLAGSDDQELALMSGYALAQDCCFGSADDLLDDRNRQLGKTPAKTTRAKKATYRVSTALKRRANAPSTFMKAGATLRTAKSNRPSCYRQLPISSCAGMRECTKAPNRFLIHTIH